ncbi:MAG: hypothetical protein FVQ81_13300 [Candidatus Glassbacteria bacterium]|nr:hypothetical protein [Candidatus Glassbacteria bacterium]
MADNPKKEQRSPRKRTVTEWTERLGARRSIVAGAAHLAGWKPDTRLGEEQFTAGVRAFEKKPLGGPRKIPANAGKVINKQEVEA